MGATMKGAMHWFRGLLSRLLFMGQIICIIPLLLALFLASPFWWLLTGKPVEPPKWARRILDGDGY